MTLTIGHIFVQSIKLSNFHPRCRQKIHVMEENILNDILLAMHQISRDKKRPDTGSIVMHAATKNGLTYETIHA